jgi:alanine racemase/UDP-N-acetylmuramoyl-tripeptide--D-alanyl-D-alanine ligase
MRLFNFARSDQRRLFIFGGIRGQSPYSQIEYKRVGQTLAKAQLRYLFVVGNKPYHALTDEILAHSPQTELFAFDNYRETFAYLQSHVRSNDFVVIKGENKLPLDLIIDHFNESRSNNQCIINLAAIETNIALLRQKLPQNTRLMVIVKALAYGTDDIRMAKFLDTCKIDILGVSYVEEGVTLKQAGVKQAIFSINVAPYETAKVVKWELEVGVNDHAIIDALAEEAIRQGKHQKVHLHINTGMGRFGCRPEEALELAQLIVSYPSLRLEGVMTHFSSADDPEEDSFTRQQIVCFDEVIAELKAHGIDPPWKHAANSAASIRFFLPQYNMVRLGLALYGLYSSDSVKNNLELKLALSLSSRIVAINICKLGETISYGRRYKVTKETQKIAILPIGYFDGLHRHYSEKTYVLIHGQKAAMVGNICMDYMMVDVTNIPHTNVGDKVLIFGEDDCGFYLSPEELASSGNSIIHELITCLGPRISRIFVYEEGKQIR